ncbi:MAG: OsmC family protein [Tissierellaceae bacterium]
MNKVNMSANLMDNMAFEFNLDGHRLVLDANEDVGGSNLGPRPKPLLLAGLIGCTGMDVVSILKKMKVDLDDLNISVEADATTEHPKVYENIKLIYRFRGKDLPMDKLEKAVTLSQDRYCGVTAMLRKATDISHEIIVEDSHK